ncbi:MAG: aminopeptidase P N-terminal domain-containing protein [Clostridiales bacterium]|jgi:Xaa-Pro aminopeptidase|nr:aminopeptidase P N-terminal domain-containing protein [Clostridiales bacterium]
MSGFFQGNRARLAASVPPNGLIVLIAGEPEPARGDEFYPFAPKRNFYYTTHIDTPFAALTIFKPPVGEPRETLFIRDIDPERAKWTDDFIGLALATEISGVRDVRPLGGLSEHIARMIFTDGADTVWMDLENRSLSGDTDETRLARKIRRAFPAVRIADLYGAFASLRRVKHPYEVRMIRHAAAITAEGFDMVLRGLAPGETESEARARFLYACARRGAGLAFSVIAAAGENAVVLHYSRCSGHARAGDLLLLDAGASYAWYSSDVSRTYPVGGKFSKRQRELYELVLAGQAAVISAAKPGVPFARLNETLLEHYAREFPRVGLDASKSGIREVYYHNVSHAIGLETHDAGRGREGALEPGMVVTAEPGIYIESEGIGIRIEDDILITDTGAEVLTAAIPKDPDEIERIMKEFCGFRQNSPKEFCGF